MKKNFVSTFGALLATAAAAFPAASPATLPASPPPMILSPAGAPAPFFSNPAGTPASAPSLTQAPAGRGFSQANWEADTYADRRAQLLDDIEFFQRKYNYASKQYATAVKAGSPDDSENWNREVTAWDNQLKRANAALADLQASPQARAVNGGRVELAIPPITLRDPSRPVEDTLPRLQLREAQAKLAELEEFRAAEGSLTRKGAKLENDPAARASMRAAQAELARLDETGGGAGRSTLAGSGIAGQGDLARLTARRAELEREVERWSRELSDYDSRYRSLQAELAKLEGGTLAKTQLEAARAELSRIDGDIAAMQAQARAAQFAQAESARADLFRPSEETTSRRTPTAIPSDGVVKRVRNAATDKAQRDLDFLAYKKDELRFAVDEAQSKLNVAMRENTSAQKIGDQAGIDRSSKDVAIWDSKLKSAQSDLAKLESDAQSKMRLIQQTVLEPASSSAIAEKDTLNIVVLEDESLNGVYLVKQGGYIVMPRVGRVNLNGMDVAGAEKAIKETLEASQLRQATVTIERTRPNEPATEINRQIVSDGTEEIHQSVIFLAGEFINAGPIRIPEGETPTLVKTILRSGGLTPSSDLTRVKLIHFEKGRGTVEEVNVQNILSGVGTPVDFNLIHGDIIVIPAYAPVIYVHGNVTRPGTLRLFQDEAMTVYSAILRSGGFTRFANKKKVFVVREIGNGEKVNIPVNILDVQAGKVPDIILQGRDIIEVPESFWSW